MTIFNHRLAGTWRLGFVRQAMIATLGWFLCSAGCMSSRPPTTKDTAPTQGASSQVPAATTKQGDDISNDTSDDDLSISFVPDFLHDVGWMKLDEPIPLEMFGGAGSIVGAQPDGSDKLLNRAELEQLAMELKRARLDDTSLILNERSLCSPELSAAVEHARPRRLLLSIQGGITARAVACMAELRAERFDIAGCLPNSFNRYACQGDAELDALASSEAVRLRVSGLAVNIASTASLSRLSRFPALQLLALSTRSRDAWLLLPFGVLSRLHYLDLAGWQGNLPDSGMILPFLRRLRVFRWPASLRGSVPKPCLLERVSGKLTQEGAWALSACSRLRELSSDNVDFVSVEPIAALHHLERLNLRHWQATQLTALTRLVELRHLSLTDSAAANFEFVAQLPRLESLDLSQTNLASLSMLGNMKALETLDVGFTAVNDLSPLRSLTGLTKLRLNNTRVVDIGPLAALRQLKELSISHTPVADLSPIVNLPLLEWVILYESQVTDIAPLFTLPHLKRANINGLTLSARQKQQLIQRLGMLNVDGI